jgi:hypothetical protein
MTSNAAGIGTPVFIVFVVLIPDKHTHSFPHTRKQFASIRYLE